MNQKSALEECDCRTKSCFRKWKTGIFQVSENYSTH